MIAPLQTAVPLQDGLPLQMDEQELIAIRRDHIAGGRANLMRVFLDSRDLKDCEVLFKNISSEKIKPIDNSITVFYRKNGKEFYEIQNGSVKRNIALKVSGVSAKALVSGALIGATVGAGITILISGGLYFFSFTSQDVAKVVPKIATGIIGGSAFVGAVLMCSCSVDVNSVIQDTEEFRKWKQFETKEKYDLYANFLKNYSLQIGEDGLRVLVEDGIICPITADIPEIPVRGGDGIVYDKRAIEAHLARVEERIVKARADGASDAEIEEIKKSASPYRIRYFTAQDLIYDLQFAQKVVTTLKRALDGFSVEANQDEFLIEICNKFIRHYRNVYREISINVAIKFSEDLSLITTNDRIKNIVKDAFIKKQTVRILEEPVAEERIVV